MAKRFLVTWSVSSTRMIIQLATRRIPCHGIFMKSANRKTRLQKIVTGQDKFFTFRRILVSEITKFSRHIKPDKSLNQLVQSNWLGIDNLTLGGPYGELAPSDLQNFIESASGRK